MMKVVSYNIENGARHTYFLLQQLIRNEAPDVLCMQEADHWHEGDLSRMEDFALSLGFRAVIFGDSNTDCKIITFSKLPVEESQVFTDGFTHCAVRAIISDGAHKVAIWNTHLDPFDEEARMREARFIAREVTADSIIMGDMNSLSRADKYTDTFLEGLRHQGNDRYGTTVLRYDTTDYFSDKGFVDVAAAKRRNANTFPARSGIEPFHCHTMRLDYIFAPSQWLDAFSSVEVIKNELTHRISDHFPITFQLDTSRLPAPAPLPERTNVRRRPLPISLR
jgi:exodeoxyribonuclease-3